ncbi:MAG: hypothetical protein IT376_18915 [Polyangiaceae bacterium]|nr:hypothetical protein [Polyangiaceae bacterium]
MSTRIEAGGPGTGVDGAATAPRVTPPPARPFRQVVEAGTQAVVRSAEAAVTRLPGGPILAAALRPPTSTAGGGAMSAEGTAGTAGTPAGGATERGGSVEDALAHQADMNLYYLELQERISAENRQYTALSNVLKARHDTVKNAIANLR